MVWLALPARVMVVPEIAVTLCPSRVEPTIKVEGTVATVTVEDAKLLLFTVTDAPTVLTKVSGTVPEASSVLAPVRLNTLEVLLRALSEPINLRVPPPIVTTEKGATLPKELAFESINVLISKTPPLMVVEPE